MRFLGRALAALMIVSISLGALTLAGVTLYRAVEARFADKAPARPARERVYSARVVSAEAGTLTPRITAYGEVRSRRTLDLRAPRPGTVVWLAEEFRDGAAVTAGQLLLRLDPRDQSATRDLAQADLDKALAEVRDARRALSLAGEELASAEGQAALRRQAVDRQRSLRDRGVGSEAALEAAELALAAAEQTVLSRRQAQAQTDTRVDQAEASAARLRITLAEAERAVAESEVRAEFSGVLSEVAVVQGGLLAGNERFGRLIDPDALEVAFRVSSTQYARLIDAGGGLLPLPVSVTAGTGAAAPATLARASAEVGAGQTGRLLFAVLDRPGALVPGDFVTVSVSEPALDGVALLPATALDSRDTVLALGGDDRLEEVAVSVLRRQGDGVIVAAGPVAGREIVAERSPLLGAGIRVRPIRPAGAAPEPASGAMRGASPAPAAAPSGVVRLSPERRAALIAYVEGAGGLPPEAKARMLAALQGDEVPEALVARIESRMGG
jgi:multidrug efflux pump subunit AcrA (membrane-fusion protein)